MAEIKPFSALRFTNSAGKASELCCPPYDIISEEQRKAYLKQNENNIIRLELPGTDAECYKTAGETLNTWLENGIVACDASPAFYLYGESFNVKGIDYSFLGFVCRVKLHEFSEGVVLPHEETLSKAKNDRFNLMCATGCNFSQVYSLYRDEKGETGKLIHKLAENTPDVQFTDSDNVTHSLWAITDKGVIADIQNQFEDRKLYIADGHHRYETALNYRRHLKEEGTFTEAADYVMMFLADMADDGLVVFPTHRIVRDLQNFDEQKLLNGAKDKFDIKNCEIDNIEAELDKAYAQSKKAFGFVTENGAKILTLKDISFADSRNSEKSEALRRLDVTVLHSLILEDILKIDKENMAKQINLNYTRDIKEALSLVNNENVNCVFILNPTRVSEISDVAAAGEKMPQKSTYFYPKLITGLVMNKIL